MSDRIVNASPLVFLAKLDRLEMLRPDGGSVFVPSEVMVEIHEKKDPASTLIDHCLQTWLEECTSRPIEVPLPQSLGRGEREVILQAIDRKIPTVVLDDLEARRVARGLGLETIGTVGLLHAAKRNGRISSSPRGNWP